ncbi:hypothetical protein BGW38_007684, partial [Lunasporangiospora selenospora]
TFISYDDIQSLTIKVAYAKTQNLAGVMLWDMGYDYNNELLTVLQGIHCTSNCPTVTTVTTTTTTATTTTTTSGTIPTTTNGSGLCAGVAAWDAARAYSAPGTKVTYSGRLYSNQWWTQGETPGAAQFGAWKDLGAC